jgi:arylformamidase
MFEYRAAGAGDIGALVDLRIDFTRIVKDSGLADESEQRATLARFFARDLASGALRCWLCLEDGRAVGSSGLRVFGALSREGPPGTGEILSVFTAGEYRRRGIGAALLELAIAKARELGLESLRLQPTDDGRPLYERAGFRDQGRDMVLDLASEPTKGAIMRIFDLSHRIEPGMPVYPGTEGPRFESATTIERDGFAERLVTMYSHTGTHMDAPAHILPGAAHLDELPAARFAGRAVILDARAGSIVHGGRLAAPWPRIGADAVSAIAPRLAGAAFLVIRTLWDSRWGEEGYYEGFPTLDLAAARIVASIPGLSGVAVDAISVDPVGVQELPVHRVLLGAGLVIVENLMNLGTLGDSDFEIVCLPLPLAGADGAPVRAVAMLR